MVVWIVWFRIESTLVSMTAIRSSSTPPPCVFRYYPSGDAFASASDDATVGHIIPVLQYGMCVGVRVWNFAHVYGTFSSLSLAGRKVRQPHSSFVCDHISSLLLCSTLDIKSRHVVKMSGFCDMYKKNKKLAKKNLSFKTMFSLISAVCLQGVRSFF